jgi:hypothetical protein
VWEEVGVEVGRESLCNRNFELLNAPKFDC